MIAFEAHDRPLAFGEDGFGPLEGVMLAAHVGPPASGPGPDHEGELLHRLLLGDAAKVGSLGGAQGDNAANDEGGEEFHLASIKQNGPVEVPPARIGSDYCFRVETASGLTAAFALAAYLAGFALNALRQSPQQV